MLFALLGIAIPIWLIISIAGLMLIIDINREKIINSFDDCAKYYPVMESYPARCKTPSGKFFTQKLPESRVEIIGKPTCLPPKNKEQPHTLECAFGLESKDKNFYQLTYTQMNFTNGISTEVDWLSWEGNVKVKGLLKTKDIDSSKYDITGTIEIESIERI